MGVLESHLSLLEQQSKIDVDAPVAEQASLVQELIAFHIMLFDFMERQIGPEGATEAERFLVGPYQRWLKTARQLMSLAREIRNHGAAVAGTDNLLRTINKAEFIAEDFDALIAMNERIKRGQRGKFYSLDEVANELRHRA